MLDKKIIDIQYQSLRGKESELEKEKNQLLEDGWQPLLTPVLVEFTNPLSYSTGTYQTWVKYE